MRISDWSSDVCSSDLVRCAQHHGRVRVYRGGDAEMPGHIRYGGEAHVDAQLRSYGIDRIGKSGADVDLPIEMARAVARLPAIDFDRFVNNGRLDRKGVV